ncbi:PhoH family protein [Flavobacteriales bacterium]|nr:PhoH family protein [Flavobacteriales bacterium]
MHEKIIEISGINPLELFGVNEVKLKLIKSFFPKLKVVARGANLKVIGEKILLSEFSEAINLLIQHFEKYNDLTENNIKNVLGGKGGIVVESSKGDDIIVHGNRGRHVKARTVNQRKMVDVLEENDMLFAIGPAGTGKTYTAVALAVRALKNKEVRRIILTRPAVEAGENLGFLPGDLKEKLDPYMRPLYDALQDMIPAEKLAEYLEEGVIQIAPLAFMRGRTLDKAFVILDEGQNTTEGQMKMFLTRMGKTAKFVVTGDVSQIDLPGHQKSGLKKAIEVLDSVKGIGFVHLDDKDVIRHKLVTRIINAFKKEE